MNSQLIGQDPTLAAEEQDAGAPACVLSFNASDPTGASGIGADIATIAAMGAHALPVVTSILVRDTAEIFEAHELDSEAVVDQAPADEAPAAVEVAPAEPAATEGDAAFVAGQWAAAFGAPAGTKFIQSDTVVRVQANGDSEKLGSVKEGDKISVTDKVEGNFRQVAFNGKVGWVLDARLGDKAPAKPEPKPAPKAKASTKTSTASKSASSAKYTGSTSYSGKTVLGLKPKAMVVYNAVTARWSFKAIGGYRATNNRSNHGSGGAIDFMTYSDSAKGWAVARYLAANAGAFDVDHIIFEQKIWTPYKPYWRPMADRGSITANHYDHVHVSVKL